MEIKWNFGLKLKNKNVQNVHVVYLVVGYDTKMATVVKPSKIIKKLVVLPYKYTEVITQKNMVNQPILQLLDHLR